MNDAICFFVDYDGVQNLSFLNRLVSAGYSGSRFLGFIQYFVSNIVINRGRIGLRWVRIAVIFGTAASRGRDFDQFAACVIQIGKQCLECVQVGVCGWIFCSVVCGFKHTPAFRSI